MLSESDIVVIAVPLTPTTQGMFNGVAFGAMKPTAFLVNTARGGLVNEADLLEALRAGRLAGAGLDVFEEEPPGVTPLLELDNVVLTPHAAGVDLKSRDDMAASAAQAIVKLSRGEWPADQVVNPEVRSKFKW